MELRNRLAAETGLRLPASLVFNHPTVTILASYLAGLLSPELAGPGPEPGAEERLRDALDHITRELAGADAAWRGRLAAALHDALDRLGDPGRGGDPDDHLDLASDEEIFAFIDNQL